VGDEATSITRSLSALRWTNFIAFGI
jgi:hypothetical protein